MNINTKSICEKNPKAGITLVETVVTLALSSLVIAALLSSFTQYRRMMKSQDIRTELQSNVRAAMQIVNGNVAMTGYGLNLPNSQLSAWITWVSDFDTNPMITDGASGNPDSIMMAGAFGTSSKLASDMTAANQITLNSGQAAKFNTSDKKLIYVGELELARITAISQNTLTISTHPSLSAGLHNSYPAGTTVELIEVREFSVDPTGGPMNESALLLDRNNTGSTYVDLINDILFYKVVAIGIEDLQIVNSASSCEVSITGVALERDLTYDGHSDGLRRFTLNQHIEMRNM